MIFERIHMYYIPCITYIPTYFSFVCRLSESQPPCHPSLRASSCAQLEDATGRHRAAKDHINIRILQTVVSGIPLTLGIGTIM